MTSTDVTVLSDAQLRALLTTVVAEYASRAQRAHADGATPMEPLDPEGVTPTDVLVTARRMLDTFDIAAFELGMMG